MQAPAAIRLAGKAVMSWQPLVSRLALPSGLPPSGNRFGMSTTAASVGSRSGTLMIEIRSCGGWQSGKVGSGKYEET